MVKLSHGEASRDVKVVNQAEILVEVLLCAKVDDTTTPEAASTT